MFILFVFFVYFHILNSLEIDVLYAVHLQQGEGFLLFHDKECPDVVGNRFLPNNCFHGVLWIRGSNYYPITLFYQKINHKMFLETKKSAQLFSIQHIDVALTPLEIIKKINNNPELCSPDHRDLYFEAQEILCFMQGYKHVLIRQRMLTHPESTGQLGSVAKTLYSPYVPPLLQYLFSHEDVGYDISVNNFGEIEDSFVFWHRNHEFSAKALVDMHAQDTTIPGQTSETEKIIFSIVCGRILGYSEESILAYIKEVYHSNERILRRGIERYNRKKTALGFQDWDLGVSFVKELKDYTKWLTDEFKPDFHIFRSTANIGEWAWKIDHGKPLTKSKVEL